jgi:DNA-binding CsgD family transcriptional regulator
MDPTNGGEEQRGETSVESRGIGPVVRRVSPGTVPGHSPAAGASLTPMDLAGGMRLSEDERTLVDALLPEITNREREVLYEIVKGGTNERVAERMGVKLPTLRTHLMRLNQKLGSTSKSDLVRLVTQAIVLDYRTRLFGSPEPVSRSGDQDR